MESLQFVYRNIFVESMLLLAAVLLVRSVLRLDTNIYFGVAGMHVSPFQAFFIPYYFLSIVAMFAHIG